jgi:hypothetical protein
MWVVCHSAFCFFASQTLDQQNKNVWHVTFIPNVGQVTFIPFIIILIIPLSPVGHVLVFSFIQVFYFFIFSHSAGFPARFFVIVFWH